MTQQATKTLEARIYDGDRAKEVLENEVFQQVWADVENDLTESWKNTPATNQNADARERIHLSLTLLRKLRATIESTLHTGKLATLELNHQKTMAERTKEFLGLS